MSLNLGILSTSSIIGELMTTTLTVKLEIMFMHTNVSLHPFSNCSVPVKIILFKSYCMSLYDSTLWLTYFKGSFQKLRSCYN